MTNSDLRGICDVCHVSVRLTQEGFLMSHPFANRSVAQACSGAGTPPAPAQAPLPGQARGPLQHYAPSLEPPKPWPQRCPEAFCGAEGIKHDYIDVEGHGRLTHVWRCFVCRAGFGRYFRATRQAEKRIRAEQRKALRAARRKASRAA